MYNYNSPIINNMMGYNVPSNPIGNVVNMGMGYNMTNMGGYYNNVYNGYYNPYLAAEQEKIRKAQEKEQMRQQSSLMKRLVKGVNNALGMETSEEALKQFDPIEISQDYELQNTNYLMNLHYNGLNYNPRLAAQVQANNQIYDKMKERFPDNMGIYEFHKYGAEYYVETKLEEDRQKQRNLSQLYNSQEYNKLISKYKGTNFSSIFGNRNSEEITLDDLEVTLPAHLSNVYEERRKMFLETILNK